MPAVSRLLDEGGGHRWQRVPPTDRRGRTHTSTVTVAVFPDGQEGPEKFALNPQDLEVRFTRDTGPGGQHRNKTESCVVVIHRPTGLSAKAAGRCQHANRREALAVLADRVQAHYGAEHRRVTAEVRRLQVGSGERGDKVRTYRAQDDVVTDHRSGKRARLRDIVAGGLDLLW